MPSFLLEIGTEEIPARFTQRALKDLNTLVSDLLETQELLEDNVRLVLTDRGGRSPPFGFRQTSSSSSALISSGIEKNNTETVILIV